MRVGLPISKPTFSVDAGNASICSEAVIVRRTALRPVGIAFSRPSFQSLHSKYWPRGERTSALMLPTDARQESKWTFTKALSGSPKAPAALAATKWRWLVRLWMLKLTPQPDFNDHLFGQSIGGEFENKLPSINLVMAELPKTTIPKRRQQPGEDLLQHR